MAPSILYLQCPAPEKLRKRSENDTPAQRMLVDAQKYQIMNEAVQPLTQVPVIVAQNERFVVVLKPYRIHLVTFT